MLTNRIPLVREGEREWGECRRGRYRGEREEKRSEGSHLMRRSNFVVSRGTSVCDYYDDAETLRDPSKSLVNKLLSAVQSPGQAQHQTQLNARCLPCFIVAYCFVLFP